MKVILTKDVDTLGTDGDVINVADGYARNYLLPRNLAIPATKGAMKDLQTRIARIRAKAEKKQQEDQAKIQMIEALEQITIEANAGDGGKLFGTITTKELARILQEKTDLTVERKQISVNAPMNRVGHYELYVKFSAKMSATVAVSIVAAQADEKHSIVDEVIAQEQADEGIE